MDRDLLDPIVAAITHRTMQPRQAKPPPARGAGKAAAAQMARRGSSERELGALAAGAFASQQAQQQVQPQETAQQQQQQQQQQPQPSALESAASEAMVDAPLSLLGEPGAELLPPFEQQMAEDGVQF
jgi:hypothetical protein